MTHGASLVLPNNAANITTAAGDTAIFRGYAASIVRCIVYQRLDGNALAGAAAATQAEMEAASSTAVQVTPGRQHFHPSAVKAWVNFNSAATIAASYNITSVTDSGTGFWTVNIATDFSSSSFCRIAYGGELASSGYLIFNAEGASAAGTHPIRATLSTGVITDPDSPDEINAVFFGDQA